MSFILLKDLYVIFVNVVSHLHLSSTKQFSLFLVRAVTYDRSGNTDSNESHWRVTECLVCCVASCAEAHLVWLQRENLQNKTSQTDIESDSDIQLSEDRYFSSRMIETQATLPIQTAQNGLTIHTADQLYLWSTG
jgi:hypothetical protein